MPTADSRPSDQSPLRVTRGRAPEPGDHVIPQPVLDHGARRLVGARPERVHERRGVQRRARRSPAAASTRRRSCGAGPAAATGPAGRRRACRAPSPARRRAAPGSGSGSCAAVVRGGGPTGSPASSHVICSRVPRQNPSSGIVGGGLQPAAGRRDRDMLPQRSTTSMWHVSPRVSPGCATVGSPAPAAPAAPAVGAHGGRNGSRPGERARSPLARRALADQRAALAAYSSESSTSSGTRRRRSRRPGRRGRASAPRGRCAPRARSTGRAGRRRSRPAAAGPAAARDPGPTRRPWRSCPRGIERDGRLVRASNPRSPRRAMTPACSPPVGVPMGVARNAACRLRDGPGSTRGARRRWRRVRPVRRRGRGRRATSPSSTAA